MTSELSIGVDFGTCWSSVVVRRSGASGSRVDYVREQGSPSPSMPSAVAVGRDGELVFGVRAWRRRGVPGAAALEFKRDFGETSTEGVGDRELSPFDLTVLFLGYLREIATGVAGGADALAEAGVTVTVPVGYAPPLRQLMVDAAAEAGLGAVSVLAEPVAAARVALSGSDARPGELVMVYDLGGGTFDVALGRVPDDGGDLVPVADAGDKRIGGRNFDSLIYHDVLAHGDAGPLREVLEGDDSRQRHEADADLQDFVLEAKHVLSDEEVFDRQIPGARRGAYYELTRVAFEDLAGPSIDKTIRTCETLLDESGFDWSDLDRVALVGGATRMPIVRARLEAKVDCPVLSVRDPELAVADGAAHSPPDGDGTRSPTGAVVVAGGKAASEIADTDVPTRDPGEALVGAPELPLLATCASPLGAHGAAFVGSGLLAIVDGQRIRLIDPGSGEESSAFTVDIRTGTHTPPTISCVGTAARPDQVIVGFDSGWLTIFTTDGTLVWAGFHRVGTGDIVRVCASGLLGIVWEQEAFTDNHVGLIEVQGRSGKVARWSQRYARDMICSRDGQTIAFRKQLGLTGRGDVRAEVRTPGGALDRTLDWDRCLAVSHDGSWLANRSSVRSRSGSTCGHEVPGVEDVVFLGNEAVPMLLRSVVRIDGNELWRHRLYVITSEATRFSELGTFEWGKGPSVWPGMLAHPSAPIVAIPTADKRMLVYSYQPLLDAASELAEYQ